MEFRVLGPIELWIADRRFDLGSLKEQCALAVLLLSAGGVVSAATLGERIWGDEPPKKARETLHAYISRLRRHLRNAGPDGPLQIATSAQGYRLNVQTSCIDAYRFEALIQQAETLVDAEPERAQALLREALALFRGEPLAGIPGDWAEATRANLLERRRAAVLKRIEIELRLGRHDQVIGELTELTARGSVDQTAVGMLMTALYNAGRPAEALAAYRRTRERLNGELALEPRRELRDLHQRILRGDPSLTPAPPPRAVAQRAAADTLERDPPHFTGREADLGALLDTIHRDLREGFTSVCVIDGMPGVGKTTLGVHAAHRLRERCPGGAVQLNLRGHNPHQAPMEPGEALIALLGMIGTDAAQLQRLDSLDACITLWRTRTAEQPVLLLLDDARDADQVSPLLPAARGSVVLITSRSRLPHLGEAHSRSLDVMPSADAAALFTRLAGAERVDEPSRLREITELCGDLPLAVAVAAGYLRSRPAWRLADLAERLGYARVQRDDGDQLTRPTRTAFDFSYHALSAAQRELFRRIGLHPGTELGLYAAAALGGITASAADRTLDVLVSHHLLDEPSRHHYRMHDLLRHYAAQRARLDEGAMDRANAIRRLLDFYLFVANSAARALRPQDRRLDVPIQNVPQDVPPVSSAAGAQTWFEDEYLNLLSVARYALDRKFYRYAAELPHALAQYLDRRGRWREAVDVHESALQAWYALGDRSGQAGALIDLAAAHWGTGSLDAALFFAETALGIYRELADEAGQADAHLQLGRVHWLARRPVPADQHLRDCSLLRAGLQDRPGLAIALYHLGIVTLEFGVPGDSLVHFEEALRIARVIRDPVIERDCLNNIGECYERMGRYPEATEHYQEALLLTRQIGGPYYLAVIAHNLGVVQSRTGDHEAALVSFEGALATFRQLGDQRNEIDTLLGMSDAYRELRRPDEAFDFLRRGLELAEQVGDPLQHAKLHRILGTVHEQRGEYPDALKAYRSALLHARRAAAPADQARAHRRIGDVLAVMRGPGAARQQWRKALELFEELKLPEARELRDLLGQAGTG